MLGVFILFRPCIRCLATVISQQTLQSRIVLHEYAKANRKHICDMRQAQLGGIERRILQVFAGLAIDVQLCQGIHGTLNVQDLCLLHRQSRLQDSLLSLCQAIYHLVYTILIRRICLPQHRCQV
jgi:hypothetical protein